MWIFYHDTVSNSGPAISDLTLFVAVVLTTAVIILAPSYYENKNK